MKGRCVNRQHVILSEQTVTLQTTIHVPGTCSCRCLTGQYSKSWSKFNLFAGWLCILLQPRFFFPCKDNVGLHAGLTRSYSRLVWNVLTYLKLHLWQPCSCFHHISWSAKVKKLRRWQAKDESCNFRLPRESDTDSTCFIKRNQGSKLQLGSVWFRDPKMVPSFLEECPAIY